ncbi:acyltransferase [Rhizobium sp. PP-F2F-G48]|uniref:acyltransferase family protein n=1 Tax=Rhizobium sp. PP-F2F-G48 TaxID=2135651 RepID=UPI00105210A7|nr:acyltransferase [Rhizobium sp. PP-F2F-G48]
MGILVATIPVQKIAETTVPVSAHRSRVSHAIPPVNNMDSLRLFFASIVVFAHCYDLTLNAALIPLRTLAYSSVAVQGFFILSGFLVTMSYERSKTLKSYLNKRIRRIYPAYFAIIVLCSVLGVWLTTLSLREYFGLDLLKYLFANLIFLNFLRPNLPGVFDGNLLNAVNGSLWTIKIEVSFYLAVPVICYFIRKFGALKMLIAIYILSFAYKYTFDYLSVTTGRNIFDLLAKSLPGQMMYFVSGAALYYYFDVLMKQKLVAFAVGIVLLGLGWGLGFEPVAPIGLALVVFSVAFGPYFGNAARFGDLSYGVYITHFPIVQTLILFGAFAANPYLATAGAYVLAVLAALVSWHLIEKQWLSRSSHYVAVNTSVPAGHTAS